MRIKSHAYTRGNVRFSIDARGEKWKGGKKEEEKKYEKERGVTRYKQQKIKDVKIMLSVTNLSRSMVESKRK